MSKTDKTSPWLIRLQAKKGWLIEEHDHTQGECDLPDKPGIEWKNDTHCTWGVSSRAWWEAGAACGCFMCRGGYGGQARNRKVRKAAKREGAKELLDYQKGEVE